MATRSKTDLKRQQLSELLRSRCRTGAMAVGSPVPAVRDLAQEFDLSRNVVSATLRELIDEGVLYTVPRVGTFVGRAQTGLKPHFLLLVDESELPFHIAIRTGFEEAVAGYGGRVLTLSYARAVELWHGGALHEINGILDLAFNPDQGLCWPRECFSPGLARVRFPTFERVEGEEECDFVSFDDPEGGAQATRHLLQMGHRSIAFLALHAVGGPVKSLPWSGERERGWRQTLLEAGIEADDLAFHPAIAPSGWNRQEERQFSAQTALALLPRLMVASPISAVVAANDHAALGLLDALRASKVAPKHWPAIVGFDNDPLASRCLMTSLRLCPEAIGQEAAKILWQRLHGELDAPCHRRVAMRLLPRLTCRPQWSGNAQDVQLVAGAL